MKYLESDLDLEDFVEMIPEVQAARVQFIWNQKSLQEFPGDQYDTPLLGAFIRSRNHYQNLRAYYRNLDWPDLGIPEAGVSTLLRTQRSILAARCAVDWNGHLADLFPRDLKFKHSWTLALHELDRLCHWALERRTLTVSEVRGLRSGRINTWI